MQLSQTLGSIRYLFTSSLLTTQTLRFLTAFNTQLSHPGNADYK